METLNYKAILIIILLAALAVLGLLLLIQRKRGHKTGRSYYIDALHAMVDGRKEDAFKLLTSAVRMGESSTDAYLQLGILLREKGQPEKALQLHKGLLVRRDLEGPEEKSVTVAIAEDLEALGRTEKAILMLENLSRRQKDTETLMLLHKLYHVRREYEKAFSAIKELGRLDRGYGGEMRAGYLASVAQMLMKNGKKSEANKMLERARKECRDSIPALYLSATLAMQEEDLESAARFWEKLIEIDIDCFGEVLPFLEKSLYSAGMFQDLERILDKLVKRHPDEPSVIIALATFYEKKGERDKAKRVLEEERSILAKNAIASAKLAALYLHGGEEEQAKRILDEIDNNARAEAAYICGSCGDFSIYPLAYCNSCSSFGPFKKAFEG
jgi:lipopolysaccharide biosynthesis regulator YciM